MHQCRSGCHFSPRLQRKVVGTGTSLSAITGWNATYVGAEYLSDGRLSMTNIASLWGIVRASAFIET
jgi:hypothetical protein